MAKVHCAPTFLHIIISSVDTTQLWNFREAYRNTAHCTHGSQLTTHNSKLTTCPQWHCETLVVRRGEICRGDFRQTLY